MISTFVIIWKVWPKVDDSHSGEMLSGPYKVKHETEFKKHSQRVNRLSLRDNFELELSDPVAVREILPQILQENVFRDWTLYSKFLNSMREYTPEQIGFVLNQWPEKAPTGLDGKFIDVPDVSAVNKAVWTRVVGESLPEKDRFAKALEIAEYLNADGYSRYYWLKLIVSQTPKFSLDQIQKLKSLNLSKSEKLAIESVLINGYDNLDESLFGLEIHELLNN